MSGRFSEHRGNGHVLVTPPVGVTTMTPSQLMPPLRLVAEAGLVGDASRSRRSR
jgi:hypothetical protein